MINLPSQFHLLSWNVLPTLENLLLPVLTPWFTVVSYIYHPEMAGTEKGDSSEIDSSTSKMCASSCGNDSQQGESSTNGTTVPADAAGTTQMEVEQSSAGCSSGDMDTEDPSTTKPTGGNVASGGAVAESSKNSVAQEQVEFKVIFNKTKLDITFALDNTIGQLKDHLSDITGVPNSMQKLMIKGLAKDCQTLREAGITKGLKVMMVGSKLNDILAVTTPSKQELEDKSSSSNVKEPFCKQKVHRKVLDKGMPDDAMPGILNTKEALPPYPLSGMLNKYGGKVRLTFKLELDQVWIGTKERTQKLAMNSIRGVVSEPIEGYEQYHILAIQLGPTEASRYWVYWVPVQYIDAIKDTIMGSWIM